MSDAEQTPPGKPAAASPPEPTERTRARALGAKAARGSVWAVAGYGVGMAMRLGGNLVLTRLLTREAFGIMLLVQAVLQGVNLFSDVGIGPSIIQNKREDATFLNTAWTLQVGRGLVLMLIVAALGWPMAVFYDPIYIWLLPFSALTALLSGFRSTKMFTANRQLAIKKLTGVEVGSRATGLAVTLAWAFIAPSVWALAAGGVVAMGVQTLLSHRILPGIRNRLKWDREAAQTLFSFGKWVFVSTVLGYFAMQSDRWVFGALVTMDAFGVYAIATLIATAPQQVFRHLALTVNFPHYSQTWRDGGDLPGAFRGGRRRVLLLGGFVCAAMIAGGPTAIEILYEPEYLDAGWMVQLLAVGTWFNLLEVTTEAALLARGESRKVAWANAGKVVVMLVLMVGGYYLAGFPGAIAGFAASEIFRYGFAGVAARPARLGGLRQELAYSGWMAVSGLAGWAAAMTLRQADAHIALEALGVAAVVSIAWAPIALRIVRNR